MRTNLTQAIEDYLKTIYELTQDEARASTNQIADVLGVTAASVSGMLKKLAGTEPPLVDYQRHHGAALTAAGKNIALEIVRHHRLLEMFLHQILGYEWDQVHAEAERLEHYISEELEERIARALGNPLHDPHGDPIPTRDLQVPDTPGQNLASLRPGESARIHRVRDTRPEVLRYLADQGVVPGVNIEIVGYSPFDENLSLRVGNQPDVVVLGPRITNLIYVECIPTRETSDEPAD